MHGKVVAIDLPNLLYAFYTAPLAYGTISPEARAEAFRGALRGLLARVHALAVLGARSVVIADGPTHPLKAEIALDRAESRIPRLTQDDYDVALHLASTLGLPILRAPHDAEACAAELAQRRHVDLVATTDTDALLMGAPVILRNLSATWPPRDQDKRSWELLELAPLLRELGDIDRPTLVLAALLMGCDYIQGVDGYGQKKAIAAAKAAMRAVRHDVVTDAHHPPGEALDELLKRFPALDSARATAALDVFYPRVRLGAPTLAWREPDLDAVRAALKIARAPEPATLGAICAEISLANVPPKAAPAVVGAWF